MSIASAVPLAGVDGFLKPLLLSYPILQDFGRTNLLSSGIDYREAKFFITAAQHPDLDPLVKDAIHHEMEDLLIDAYRKQCQENIVKFKEIRYVFDATRDRTLDWQKDANRRGLFNHLKGKENVVSESSNVDRPSGSRP